MNIEMLPKSMSQTAVDHIIQSKTKTGRVRRVAWIALVLLVAWLFIAWLAARALIVRAELPRADAIVVFSGSNSYTERTQHAAQLFNRGVAPKIILTDDKMRGGWNSAQQRNPYFVERGVEELQRAGVPADKIEVLPEAVSTTYDESLRVRQYAQESGLDSVLIVTSAYHSRRTLWTMRQVFRGSGVEIGIDPPAAGAQSPSAIGWWLYPSGWRSVALEYPKIIYYWLRYR